MLEERHSLPIFETQQTIVDTIARNPVVIIRGATGCGKTTQVPQFILDSFIQNMKGAFCNIIVTQVRCLTSCYL